MPVPIKPDSKEAQTHREREVSANTFERIKKEAHELYEKGVKLAQDLQSKKDQQFHYDYQSWYTKALPLVRSLASDRLAEFRGYYEIDPRRKSLGYGTFVIQDYLKNIVPRISDFDARAQATMCFFNQLTILNAIHGRIDSALSDIEGALYADIQDGELEVARRLMKVSHRAAGSLVGVLIEGHPQRVAASSSVSVAKKNPTISDLNEALKAASKIDVPTWRKITYLADIRNICSHKKDAEPSAAQVQELVDGADWLMKNVN